MGGQKSVRSRVKEVSKSWIAQAVLVFFPMYPSLNNAAVMIGTVESLFWFFFSAFVWQLTSDLCKNSLIFLWDLAPSSKETFTTCCLGFFIAQYEHSPERFRSLLYKCLQTHKSSHSLRITSKEVKRNKQTNKRYK